MLATSTHKGGHGKGSAVPAPRADGESGNPDSMPQSSLGSDHRPSLFVLELPFLRRERILLAKVGLVGLLAALGAG